MARHAGEELNGAFVRLFGRLKPDLSACTFYFRCDCQYAGGAVVAHVVAYLYKIDPYIEIHTQYVQLN